jgi:CubicO group peptidase (beta-lactamase class C family)
MVCQSLTLNIFHLAAQFRLSRHAAEQVFDLSWKAYVIIDVRVEYLEGFVKRHPVFPTQFTPIYSNAAFHILGYALEGIVGDSFENIMKRDIFEPLGLGNSSVSKPESGSGVIPSGETHWETDIGDDTP